MTTRTPAAPDPYGDCCLGCRAVRWPHTTSQRGDWLTASYRCPCGESWQTGWSVWFATALASGDRYLR